MTHPQHELVALMQKTVGDIKQLSRPLKIASYTHKNLPKDQGSYLEGEIHLLCALLAK